MIQSGVARAESSCFPRTIGLPLLHDPLPRLQDQGHAESDQAPGHACGLAGLAEMDEGILSEMVPSSAATRRPARQLEPNPQPEPEQLEHKAAWSASGRALRPKPTIHVPQGIVRQGAGRITQEYPGLRRQVAHAPACGSANRTASESRHLLGRTRRPRRRNERLGQRRHIVGRRCKQHLQPVAEACDGVATISCLPSRFDHAGKAPVVTCRLQSTLRKAHDLTPRRRSNALSASIVYATSTCEITACNGRAATAISIRHCHRPLGILRQDPRPQNHAPPSTAPDALALRPPPWPPAGGDAG